MSNETAFAGKHTVVLLPFDPSKPRSSPSGSWRTSTRRRPRALREVVAKVEKANAGYRAVSVEAEVDNGAAEADVALLKGTETKQVAERL